jgi:V/A-type H+-transporting ATPase subunit D
VSGVATRWRLIELQRRRRAIRRGADLLDRKREGLLRALAERTRAAAGHRERFARALAGAYALLDRALIEIGEAAARAATLAPPRLPALTITSDAILGVRVPRLTARLPPPALHYGPGGTCAALDEAVRAFTALIPGLVRIAEEEAAERSLRRGLRRTTRTLNALRSVLLPVVEADIRAVASSLEEEEREEAIRWRAGRPERRDGRTTASR